MSITPDGSYVTAGTRGGDRQLLVFARDGRLALERRSAAVRQDSVWVGANGAAPELWFTRLSADARRAVFAGWSGAAYFLAMP